MTSGFCTLCDAKFASFEGLLCCPNCNTTTLPCEDSEQVNININWHELAIIAMWAERWARTNDLMPILRAIISRIKSQHPDKGPLLLEEEIALLNKNGYTLVEMTPEKNEKN